MKMFKNVVSHNGQRCDVLYVHVDTFNDVPDELILKTHSVCFCNGKILLVNHPEWGVWGIPGGTREPGESIEQTMRREVQEETNCKVIRCQPISYQKVVTPNNEVHYRVQYLCTVEPLGDFKSDPAGNINKILWIDPGEYGKYIEKKEMKKAIFERAISVFRNIV